MSEAWWLGDGTVAGSQLVLTCDVIVRTGGGMWGFQNAAQNLIWVTSPLTADPMGWSYSYTRLPTQPNVSWSSAIQPDSDGLFVYIFGTKVVLAHMANILFAFL